MFVKQDEQVVGWAELVKLNLVLRPYGRGIMEDELVLWKRELERPS